MTKKRTPRPMPVPLREIPEDDEERKKLTTIQRGPDEEEGAFIDWNRELHEHPRDLAPLPVNATAHPRARYDDGIDADPHLVPGPDGHVVRWYERRTGWGIPKPGLSRLARLIEALRAPEMALRRWLFVAWVAVLPTVAQLRAASKRKRARERLLVVARPRLEPGTPDLGTYVVVVPVLRESVVRLIPKWLMRQLARRQWVLPLAATWGRSGLSGALGHDLVSGDAIIAHGSSGAAATHKGIVDLGTSITRDPGEVHRGARERYLADDEEEPWEFPPRNKR